MSPLVGKYFELLNTKYINEDFNHYQSWCEQRPAGYECNDIEIPGAG